MAAAAGPAGAVEAAGRGGPGLPGVGLETAFAAEARARGLGMPHWRGAAGATTIAGVGAGARGLGPQTVNG